jgi:N-acetylglucosamine-6-phosphate deacetylase
MRNIDIHIHGIDGYDTRTTDENHILKAAEILGSHGVSEIIFTIYPSTVKVMRGNMMTVRKAMERQQSVVSSQPPPPSPLPRRARLREGVKASNLKLARIIGLHLEGPFLNPTRCGALGARSFIEPTEKSFQQLIEGFEDVVKIVTIAPELKGALQLIKKISDGGIIVSMGHSDATFSEAEAGFHAGAKGITHIFNAMRRFHHREMGIAGFGLLNKDIYIEVIADPFHLHPETLELIFKIKNPQKIIIVSDAVKETPSPAPLLSSASSPGQPLSEGTKGKKKGISDTEGKLLGGSMTIVESAQRLINAGFDEGIVMNCITKNPAKYLSL